MLSNRERFLIREAFNAALYYTDADLWLAETISDAGHTVEQHLEHDADRLHRKANFIIE